jgi:drug/metabolite transporter (DMT)-like permease
MGIFICLFLFSVFISSISQIILKKSANAEHQSSIREYLNFKVIFAYGIFFVSSLLTMLSYKKVPLSMGAIFEATGYIWVTILGYFILKENVNKKKIIGLCIIIIGIVIANIKI